MAWIKEPADLRIPAYCSIIAFGPSNAGKSTLACQIALERDNIFIEKHNKVIIYYQNNQSIFAEAKKGDKAIVLVNSKEELEREIVPKSLIIFDDQLLSSVGAESKYVTNFFIQRSHHSLLTVILQAQSYFPVNGNVWAQNASHFLFLKSSYKSSIQRFLKSFSDSDFLWQAYRRAVEGKQYAHLFLSVHAKVDDNLRVRSSIIPSTGVEVYLKEDAL